MSKKYYELKNDIRIHLEDGTSLVLEEKMKNCFEGEETSISMGASGIPAIPGIILYVPILGIGRIEVTVGATQVIKV